MQAVRRWAQVAITLSALFFQRGADAACNRPDIEFAVPPDGAEAVPPNAKLFARYKSNAEYLGEDITLAENGGEPVALTGEWSSTETLLSVAPGLEPGSSYDIEWPRLRGVNSGSLGRGLDLAFQVGTTLDEAPPVFGGLTGVDWDVDRERDDCTDSLEERYLFDFELGEASDDGGRESLVVLLFQTKGPKVKGSAPEPVSVQRMPREGKTLRLSRTLGDGEGDVCFAAVARDLTGKVSASGAEEVCVETVAPPFFDGCSVGHAPASRGAWLLGLALWAALGRRRSLR